MCRRRWLGVLVIATAGVGSADDPKTAADNKAFDKLVVDTLRDVHDRGADLYNTKKDYGGAYRMYEGSLRTVRPLLSHRPDVQKTIDDGLAAAELQASLADRAVALHKTIEDVRATLRAAKSPEVKKPDDKKVVTPPETKKPDDKKVEPVPMPKLKDGVLGVVTLNGKPLAEATITFVSLTQPKPKVYSAAIKDGKYSLAETPPAGKYAVAVSAKKDGKELLPAKYATVDSSGLTAEIKPGPNSLDINLKE
jgi:hypothetical protein